MTSAAGKRYFQDQIRRYNRKVMRLGSLKDSTDLVIHHNNLQIHVLHTGPIHHLVKPLLTATFPERAVFIPAQRSAESAHCKFPGIDLECRSSGNYRQVRLSFRCVSASSSALVKCRCNKFFTKRLIKKISTKATELEQSQNPRI